MRKKKGKTCSHLVSFVQCAVLTASLIDCIWCSTEDWFNTVLSVKETVNTTAHFIKQTVDGSVVLASLRMSYVVAPCSSGLS